VTILSKAEGLCSSFGYNARTIVGGWFRKDTGELGDPEVDESLVQSWFVRPSLH